MGVFIGMDEAGYGPNLGPLVVTATVWELPDHPRRYDLWSAQADVIDQRPPRNSSCLHVADSKQVYNSAQGIGPLEKSVLSALSLCDALPASFRKLARWLTGEPRPPLDGEPWLDDSDLDLPHTAVRQQCVEMGTRWSECCREHGIRLKRIASEIVLTERFNRLTREYGTKGMVLSRLSLRLLKSVWNREADGPTLIVADKHGGRNRYDLLLSEILDGQMIFRQQESRACSRYRVGSTEICFQTKAESHCPVALASMVSKYVRELAMMLFNQFWSRQVAGIKPTKGYPVDALRFKKDVAEARARLGIADELFWRIR